MKRSELYPQPFAPIEAGQPDGNTMKDVHFVHSDGPSVRVRHYVVDDGRRVRYSAELTSIDGGTERAIIDASTGEELSVLLEIAARAFSSTVRLRSRRAAGR